MDDNSHTNDGFFHHFLEPQSGHSVFNLMRGILPGHRQQSQGASNSETPLSLGGSQAGVQQSQSAILAPHPERISTGSGLNSEPNVPGPSGTAARSHSPPHATISPTSTSPSPINFATSEPSNSSEGNHDVDMIQESSASSSSNPSQSLASSGQSRSTRRARVDDDDEDGDHLRESNRQRMNSPTADGDEHEHHFMPIPEDHGVPQSARETTRSGERNAHGATESEDSEAEQGRAPPPPYSRMMWTFDFVPIPIRNGQGAQGQGRGQGQGQGNMRGGRADDHPQEANHDGHPSFNFFIDFPIPGHQLPPQPGTVPNNNAANEGGNIPANAGFAIPPLPFLFGMDHLEERDDPERAKRLVDGLEDVPVGLVKRMQRVGGPGTSQGDIPSCAVCWESLLDPQGGGFEGNAELAKAEADQAARDTAASQQGRESSIDSAPVSSSSSLGQPSSDAPTSAPSTTMPDLSGEKKYPRIVVLPCSHAFHATCLLPWFSKPGRTTCPSCRFDIDPDSLTYRPPLRAHPHPHPAPQPGAAPQAQQQPLPHILFGPPPPPPPPQSERVQPAPDQAVPNSTAGAFEPQPAHGQQPAVQQRQQPLPPFVSFDISMIIPIFPGRGPAGAPPRPAGAQSAQGTNAVPSNDQGSVPPPLPPRTDNHGFRLDNTLLQEAVVSTFQRIMRQQPPPVFFQAPPAGGPAPDENGSRPAPLEQQWYTFAGPIPGFPPMPPPNAHAVPQGAPHHRSGARRPAEKQQWTPPPAPGPTLRQVVERNEREMGLRCSDVSCGLGPSDDDPVSTIDLTTFRQIAIRPSKSDPSGKEAVCKHKFHPSCLVSAERVAGWGHEVKTGEPAGDGEDVEVSCPVCRAVGVISRLEWEEGACALA